VTQTEGSGEGREAESRIQIENPKQRQPCYSAASTLHLNSLSGVWKTLVLHQKNSQEKALGEPGMHALPRAWNR